MSVTTTTAWTSCSSHGAVTVDSGDNNGYQTNPAEACDDDSVFAVDTNSGNGTSTACNSTNKDRHRFWGFRSVCRAACSRSTGSRSGRAPGGFDGRRPDGLLRLSWDGGTSWTSYVALGSTLTTTETTYTLGGAANLWGRTSWSPSELGASTFRVEITDVASSTARDFSLDGLKVRVTYHP